MRSKLWYWWPSRRTDPWPRYPHRNKFSIRTPEGLGRRKSGWDGEEGPGLLSSGSGLMHCVFVFLLLHEFKTFSCSRRRVRGTEREQTGFNLHEMWYSESMNVLWHVWWWKLKSEYCHVWMVCAGLRLRMGERRNRRGPDGHLQTSTCVWTQSWTPQRAGGNQPAWGDEG